MRFEKMGEPDKEHSACTCRRFMQTTCATIFHPCLPSIGPIGRVHRVYRQIRIESIESSLYILWTDKEKELSDTWFA